MFLTGILLYPINVYRWCYQKTEYITLPKEYNNIQKIQQIVSLKDIFEKIKKERQDFINSEEELINRKLKKIEELNKTFNKNYIK